MTNATSIPIYAAAPLLRKTVRLTAVLTLWLVLAAGTVFAQDVKVDLGVDNNLPNIGETRIMKLTVTNGDATALTSFDVVLDVPANFEFTGASTENACDGGTCSFSVINDQKAKVSYSGALTSGAVNGIKFDIDVLNVAAGNDLTWEATAENIVPDEAGDAAEPNFDTVTLLDVNGPDLTLAISETAGPTPFPATFTTGDMVTIEIEATNENDVNIGESSNEFIVSISTPGLKIDLTSIAGDGGTCDIGTNCSFDPTSGLWLVSGGLANGTSTTLTFDAEVLNVDFAGAWSASVVSSDPPERDETNSSTSVGVTINDAPVWQRLHSGPFDGTVTSVFATHGSVRVFAGTDGDGVFHSRDAGANWCKEIPESDLGDFVRGVALVEDNSGNERVVAASFGDTSGPGQDGGIFVSTNGGRTFEAAVSQPSDPRSHSLLAFEDSGDDFLLLGTEDGLFVSPDPGGPGTIGSDWSANKAPASGTDAQFLALAADDAHTQLLAGTANGRLFKSDDNGGTNFTRILVAGVDPLAGLVIFDLTFNEEAGGHFYYAATNDGIYKSGDDDPSTWTKVSFGVGVQIPVTRSVVAYSFGGSDYVIAGADGGQIFFSSDAGATWTLSGIGFPNLTVYDLTHFGDEDASYLYAGSGNGGLFVSFDNGTSWVQSQLQLPNIQVNALLKDDVLIAGTFGNGIYRNDESCGWEPFGGQPASNDGTVNDRGLTNPWVESLVMSDRGTYFAGTWNGGIFRTPDQSDYRDRLWQASGLPNLQVYDIGVFVDNLDREFLLAGANLGEIYRSVDDGFTWDKFVLGSSPVYAVAGLAGTNDLLAGTFGTGIFFSGDFGETWTQTNLTTQHVFDIVETTYGGGSDDVFAATATGIYRSSDGGATWTAVADPDVAGKDVRGLTFSSGTLWGTVWGGGVVKTTDGTSWEPAGLDDIQDNVRLFTTHLSQNDDGEWMEELYAVTERGEVYVRTRRVAAPETQTTVATDDPAELPTAYQLEQNYPNPFNPTTAIEFALPEASRVQLVVFDLLGRQVATLVNGALSAGQHQVRFDAADLPSGTYFYRLVTPKQTITRSMILLK